MYILALLQWKTLFSCRISIQLGHSCCTVGTCGQSLAWHEWRKCHGKRCCWQQWCYLADERKHISGRKLQTTRLIYPRAPKLSTEPLKKHKFLSSHLHDNNVKQINFLNRTALLITEAIKSKTSILQVSLGICCCEDAVEMITGCHAVLRQWKWGSIQ